MMRFALTTLGLQLAAGAASGQPPVEAPPVDLPPPVEVFPGETVIIEEGEVFQDPPAELIIEEEIPPDHWAVIEFVHQWWRPAPFTHPYNAGPVRQLRPRMPLNLDGSAFRYDTRPGFNLLFGSPLADFPHYGYEIGVSWNGASSDTLSVGGGLLGESPFIPYLIAQTDPPDGQSRRLLFAPGTGIGFQEMKAWVKLVTTQANLTRSLTRGPHLQLEALGGFRYLHLGESLYVGQAVTPAEPLPGEPGVFTAVDQLSTRTDFYGGQVGLRGLVRGENLYLEMTSKLGIGGTQDIVRYRSLTAPTVSTVPPNRGFTDVCGDFALLPELTVRFGFVCDNGAHLFVGYNFLYLSDVVRLADFVGPATPEADRHTEFWAHGLTLGVAWTY